MPKGPTVKQRRFAAEIAAGRSKRLAYAISHPGQKMSLPSLRAAATRAAKSPAVQAEIQRLIPDPVLFEVCPAATDPAKIREHSVAIMAKLSCCSDPYVAFYAATWLVNYADELDAKTKLARPSEDKQALLRDLRGLYRRALAPAPLVVETVGENVPETAPES